MSTYQVGDRVQHARWDVVGTVKRIDEDGDLYVKWDNHLAEDQLDPYDVRPASGVKVQ